VFITSKAIIKVAEEEYPEGSEAAEIIKEHESLNLTKGQVICCSYILQDIDIAS